MVTDLLIFGGWLGLLTIIAVIDELLKKRKKVRMRRRGNRGNSI
jgi:hypothetical protein